MAALVRSSSIGLSRHFSLRCFTRLACRSCEKTGIKKTGTAYSTASSNTANTDPVKDVILYSDKNSRFHKYVNMFGLAQLLIWLSLAEYSTKVTNEPVEGDADEKVAEQLRNSEDEKAGIGFAQLFAGLGLVTLGISWIYSLRCIKMIVLRKGGENLTLITYGPFNKVRYLDMPLEKVSAAQLRSSTSHNLPIKVKGYVGHFLVDMRGEIKNSPLLDATLGLKRNLK